MPFFGSDWNETCTNCACLEEKIRDLQEHIALNPAAQNIYITLGKEIDMLKKALRPFADFNPLPRHNMDPDDTRLMEMMIWTTQSPDGKTSLTIGDFMKAKEAIYGKPNKG